MELNELRQMSAGDLAVKEREAREEVFRLRLKLRTSQLDNPTTLRTARRELAQEPAHPAGTHQGSAAAEPEPASAGAGADARGLS